MMTEIDGETPITDQEAYARLGPAAALLGEQAFIEILERAKAFADRVVPTVRFGVSARPTTLMIHGAYGQRRYSGAVELHQLLPRNRYPSASGLNTFENMIMHMQRTLLPRDLWTDPTGQAIAPTATPE